MPRPELGEKRVCAECGTKYYDMHRDPITCPKCGALFQLTGVRPETEAEGGDDEDTDEDDAPEVVSVDTAAETGAVPDDLPEIDDDGEIEDVEDNDDDTLLEADDDDGDVGDIIGVDDTNNDDDT